MQERRKDCRRSTVFRRRHGGRNNYVTIWHARAEFGQGVPCKYPEIIPHNFGHGFGIEEMRARHKVAIAAVPLFAVLVLPFFMSIAAIADVFEVSHYLYFWSIPIHTEVSEVEPVYETGEPIEFTVAHYNFGYYQQYPQYEISKEGRAQPVISGGMTDSPIHYTPFTVLAVWQGNWEVGRYTERYFVDGDGNKMDSRSQADDWSVVTEKKPITLAESGNYTLHVYTTARYDGISIPFEVVEK